jgi:uncharacterized protein
MTKIDNSVQKTLVIMVGIIAVVLIGIFAYSSFSPSNTVTGNGQSTIKVTPDRISVYFNVETKGTTSQIASDSNSKIMDDLTTALIKKGFTTDQIQTVSFNIYPNYNYDNGKQTQDGFTATHSIKIEMPTTDSEKIGSVIDAGISAGAGISYIDFELSSAMESNYKAQALTQATQDAKAKAQAIATGLGKKLGRLVSVTESSFNYYPWRLYDSASSGSGSPSATGAEAKSATANITPNQQEVSASIIAVYKLA